MGPLGSAVEAVGLALVCAGASEGWAGALGADAGAAAGAGAALVEGGLEAGAGVAGGGCEAVGVVLPASGSMYCWSPAESASARAGASSASAVITATHLAMWRQPSTGQVWQLVASDRGRHQNVAECDFRLTLGDVVAAPGRFRRPMATPVRIRRRFCCQFAAAGRSTRVPGRSRPGHSRRPRRTTAGTTTTATMARNQTWPASVPSPSEWASPSSHTSAVNR